MITTAIYTGKNKIKNSVLIKKNADLFNFLKRSVINQHPKKVFKFFTFAYSDIRSFISDSLMKHQKYRQK
jgi:hypothetical protein